MTVIFSLERTFLMSCYFNLSPTEDSNTKSSLQKTSIENYYKTLIYGEIPHSRKGSLVLSYNCIVSAKVEAF